MTNRTLYILAALFFLCAGVLVFWGIQTDSSMGQLPSRNGSVLEFILTILVGCVAVLVGGFIYLFPGINAEMRHHRERKAITVLNVCLGWTLLGWVTALVWSYTSQTATSDSPPATRHPPG